MEVGDRLRGIARTDVVHVRHRVLVAVVLNIKDFVLIMEIVETVTFCQILTSQ